MPRLAYVKAYPTVPFGEVALWDRDADHPNGEVFIAGGMIPVQVAMTDRVQQAVLRKRLVEVTIAEESQPKPRRTTTAAE
jgi:hypothetical protein